MKEKSISFIRLSVIEEDQKTVRAKQGEVGKRRHLSSFQRSKYNNFLSPCFSIFSIDRVESFSQMGALYPHGLLTQTKIKLIITPGLSQQHNEAP